MNRIGCFVPEGHHIHTAGPDSLETASCISSTSVIHDGRPVSRDTCVFMHIVHVFIILQKLFSISPLYEQLDWF